MNARKNNFPAAVLRKTRCLLINILRLTASHPPADIGDQAVAAELIAPVLNLKKGPRMAGAPTDMKTLIAPRGIDIQRSVRMRLDQLRQTALLILSLIHI